MPITSIGDLNTGRTISPDFVVSLVRKADGTFAVLTTFAVKAGEVVIANYNAEDIWTQLSPTQQNTIKSLINTAEGKVKTLAGL